MQRKTWLMIALAFGMAAPAVGAAESSITTQLLPGVDFSAYKTYSWVHTKVPAGADPAVYKMIMTDLDGALARKGYQETASGGDLSLLLTIGRQNKDEIRTWQKSGMPPTIYQYTEGQLSIDAFDPKSHQAVWHGQATQAVTPSNPDTAKISATIEQLMVQFPASAAASAQP